MRRKYAETGKNHNAQRAFQLKWAAEQAAKLKETRTVTEASIDVSAEDPPPQGVVCNAASVSRLAQLGFG